MLSKWPCYQALYRFNAVSTKIPVTELVGGGEAGKEVLKFILKSKRPRIAQAILSKKGDAAGTTILDFKLHYRAAVTKPAWH